MEDRSSCSKGVAGGSCRSGQNQSITTHLIDNLTIDLQLERACGRNLIAIGPQIEVVESPVMFFVVLNIRLLKQRR